MKWRLWRGKTTRLGALFPSTLLYCNFEPVTSSLWAPVSSPAKSEHWNAQSFTVLIASSPAHRLVTLVFLQAALEVLFFLKLWYSQKEFISLLTGTQLEFYHEKHVEGLRHEKMNQFYISMKNQASQARFFRFWTVFKHFRNTLGCTVFKYRLD